ncbi:hypothetical protein [Amycolatopsis sp. lyj-84]|uniref:hypothetical protein n=1 Tax=Amycolatopsis sp. lyj-84 TaxID=2789284 RepID=UPI00397AE5C1
MAIKLLFWRLPVSLASTVAETAAAGTTRKYGADTRAMNSRDPKQELDSMPWDEFVEVNDFYMGYRGWERYDSPHGDAVRYVFQDSLSDELERIRTTTLGTALLQVAECHFTRTRRGLRIRIITSGAPGGCRKHDSSSFRVEMCKVRWVDRLVKAVEERAIMTASTELAYCLIFGACAKRVSALLEAAATKYEPIAEW